MDDASLAAIVVSLAAVAVAAIIKFPARSNGVYMRRETCAEMHKNLSTRITNVEQRVTEIEREGRNH